MKILTLNCGSSSIKFKFFNIDKEEVLASGIIEKIGEEISLFTYKSEVFTKKKRGMVVKDHAQGIEVILDTLTDEHQGVIKNEDEIDAVGHRLVHGGEFFSDTIQIDKTVMNVLHQCIDFAPLHNPANIRGVEGVKKVMPNIPQCGVFDTAFHQTMEPHAYLYPIPLKYYSESKIRRYGFHGTSHKYVALEASKYLNKSIDDLKIITCHLGNGASMAAVKGGKSIDTSMGFTPLEGLMMGTRCGDIDPAIPLLLMKKFDLDVDQVNNILNKQSGMLGLSELSNDMRTIEEEILEKSNPKAIQALNVYAYKIKKYIGSYVAALNGVDVIVFTGGIGENMPILRKDVCSDLEYLGINLDEKENDQFKGGILNLSADDSKVKILKIPTDEELMIAMETVRVLKEKA